MAFYRTMAIASFVAMLVFMTERSNTHNHGGIRSAAKSCNQTCWISDDDSTTRCPSHCICQARRGSTSVPQYGEGLCVKAS
uniref:Secreted peptide n=1 Tax=Rhipicephalus pulchellus TaxID=72859 RepID=L7LYD7_RHIPC